MSIEIWQHIPGFEMYEVSSLGAVRRSDTKVAKKCSNSRNPKYDRPAFSVSRNNKSKVFWLHEAIMLSFHGPTPKGLEIRHIDGNRNNNCLSNLTFGTRKQNMHDKIKHGTLLFGETTPSSKLTNNQVKQIIEALEQGQTCNAIAKLFDVNLGTIWDIKVGRSWSWLTGKKYR